jgi:hypothetical protein
MEEYLAIHEPEYFTRKKYEWERKEYNYATLRVIMLSEAQLIFVRSILPRLQSLILGGSE